MDNLEKKVEEKNRILEYITSINIKPERVNEFLKENESQEINQPTKLYDLISRPQVSLEKLINKFSDIIPDDFNTENEIIESVDITVKYRGYIDREKKIADKIGRLSEIIIPENFDYSRIHSLSTEARMKLKKVKPSSIGQASRISGVSPSDINVLLIFIGR